MRGTWKYSTLLLLCGHWSVGNTIVCCKYIQSGKGLKVRTCSYPHDIVNVTIKLSKYPRVDHYYHIGSQYIHIQTASKAGLTIQITSCRFGGIGLLLQWLQGGSLINQVLPLCINLILLVDRIGAFNLIFHLKASRYAIWINSKCILGGISVCTYLTWLPGLVTIHFTSLYGCDLLMV